ncbi:type II toxin-antitoxin system prevent-host-death family antitoxin [Acidihalobacter yilgarnensis]|uniref:type II toxin-antitoxin system prevent-host-death family antitoxin n=1 Tax=Acidihalobacter yilgarnensis TaxID=2819280 RepID=UPI0009F56DEB|nr:type II toxin-antitoxin system prevent-host-death family antitoxin [Acidihalobacter yilgarnensis]
MIVTIISSRRFNQYAGKAKKAANDGPVFITVHGEPTHVLLNIHEYKKLLDYPEHKPNWVFVETCG